MHDTKEFEYLKQSLDSYWPVAPETWESFKSFCKVKYLTKNTTLYVAGKKPKSFSFVCQGLVRAYVISESGQEYNKNFFCEGQFPGSMTALLTDTPSKLGFETIEDTQLVEIDFADFRKLMSQSQDLMLFQIHYLEKNWLLHKDAREIELVQDEATARYLHFLEQYPDLVDRLPLYHVASHLGITPTQLSRIRKSLNP